MALRLTSDTSSFVAGTADNVSLAKLVWVISLLMTSFLVTFLHWMPHTVFQDHDEDEVSSVLEARLNLGDKQAGHLGFLGSSATPVALFTFGERHAGHLGPICLSAGADGANFGEGMQDGQRGFTRTGSSRGGGPMLVAGPPM